MIEQLSDRIESDSTQILDPFSLDPREVIEVPLLLSAEQVRALEQAAHHRGMTAGAMVRRLLHDFIRTLTTQASTA